MTTPSSSQHHATMKSSAILWLLSLAWPDYWKDTRMTDKTLSHIINTYYHHYLLASSIKQCKVKLQWSAWWELVQEQLGSHDKKSVQQDQQEVMQWCIYICQLQLLCAFDCWLQFRSQVQGIINCISTQEILLFTLIQSAVIELT